MVPNNPEALLTREQTAAALTEAGYPIKKKTLDTKACRGGGPPFRKFCRYRLYKWSETLAWAEAQLGPVQGSTSEADAA
jgi:hypothetical protein